MMDRGRGRRWAELEEESLTNPPLALTKSEDALAEALERDGRILLAHDMGLGKTVTGLTIMNHYRGDWPLLILCPKAVLTQWAEEVARWCRHPRTGPPTTAIVKGKVTRQGKSVIDIKGSVVRGDMKVKKFDGEVKVVITTFDVFKGQRRRVRLPPGRRRVARRDSGRVAQVQEPGDETDASRVARGARRGALRAPDGHADV